MEKFFSEQTYYEFPSFEAAVFALLLSFVLSTVIAFTYRYTYRGSTYSRDFFQAIVLVSVIAGTIMMAIGDSLARGLGILGALAIIRFRFRFENPKNIVYIFASLAAGIASGVYGFAIAVAGTFLFSAFAFVLYFSPFGKTDFYDIRISFTADTEIDQGMIENFLKNNCERYRLLNIRTAKSRIRYAYRIRIIKSSDRKGFFDKLSAIEGISNIRLDTRGSVDRI